MTDVELQEKLNRWYAKMNRYKDDKLNQKLFKQAGFFNKRTKQALSSELFHKRYDGSKFKEIVDLLDKQLDRNYIFEVNYDRKENIVKMLYAMGLDEDAKQLKGLGIKKFMELDKDDSWKFVKEIYDSNKETLIAEQVKAIPLNKSQDEIHEEIREMDIAGNSKKYQTKMEDVYRKLGWL